MRRTFRSIHLSMASLIAFFAIASTPAEAQSSARDDPVGRAAALAARYGAMRTSAIEHGARDPVRLTANDYASTSGPAAMPYRSTPSADAPGGFAMRLPGTGLDLTNGSLSIRHTNDPRYAKGVHFSVQLTY